MTVPPSWGSAEASDPLKFPRVGPERHVELHPGEAPAVAELHDARDRARVPWVWVGEAWLPDAGRGEDHRGGLRRLGRAPPPQLQDAFVGLGRARLGDDGPAG